MTSRLRLPIPAAGPCLTDLHRSPGVSGEALKAVPQIIVPHMFDQRYWASRVRANGLGPAPLKRYFTSDALASAIRETLGDAAMAPRALPMAERIRASQGTQRAVEVLEEEISARVRAAGR